MKKIALKPISESYQSIAQDLILSGLGERWGFIDKNANPDINSITEAYKNGYFVTAWLGNNMIGTGGILLENEGTYRVQRMSVNKSNRRNGIGAMILNDLKSWAKNRNAHTIVLETTSTWKDAILFYNQCGFQVVWKDQENGISPI